MVLPLATFLALAHTLSFSAEVPPPYTIAHSHALTLTRISLTLTAHTYARTHTAHSHSLTPHSRKLTLTLTLTLTRISLTLTAHTYARTHTAHVVQCRIALILIVEVIWNVYPSNAISSSVLFAVHLVILADLVIAPLPKAYRELPSGPSNESPPSGGHKKKKQPHAEHKKNK